MKICVYGAASNSIDKIYVQEGEILGEEIAKRGHSLVFGGGAHGLMGAVARGVSANNGKILAVIPSFFTNQEVEVLYTECEKVIYTDTMRERKQIMEDNADGFIITPGGIGTFEEFFEILTLKQLNRHNKPIAIFNVNGYYDELLVALKKSSEQNFLREDCLSLYKVFTDVNELLVYMENYNDVQKSVKELKEG